MKSLVLVLVFLAWFAAPAGADFSAGMRALDRGDYATAFKELKPEAEKGSALAQLFIGSMYASGHGVPQDLKESVRWVRRAAEQGLPEAQYLLGTAYSNGQGVPQDFKEALRWFRLAADQGNASAQKDLGIMYATGKGVPQDDKEALRWYRLAAEQGHADAQFTLGAYYNGGTVVPQDFKEGLRWYRLAAEQGHAGAQFLLGAMYAKGQGVPQDYKKAVRWYRLAAEQGHADAQAMLGFMYYQGRGGPQDYVQAHMWLNLAAIQGDKEASEARDRVVGKMSQSQIEEAQRLAREWKPKNRTSPDRQQETSGSQLTASGTGFVISRQGHVLTNNHVIDGCMTIRTTNEGRKKQLTVVGTDPENDLALLKLPSPSPNIARFREGRHIRAGDSVVAVGFPLHGLLASEANVTTGVVSALAGIGNDTRFFQITVPIQPGNSGGPLLDQGGNIVGIIVGKLDAIKIAKATGDLPQNINFAISGAVAKSFLDSNSVEYEVASSGKRLESSDVGEQAKQFTLLLECFK